MYSAGFSIGIFIGLTIFYFGLKFFLVDRIGPPMNTGMIKTALALTYIMGIIGSQLTINISNTKEQRVIRVIPKDHTSEGTRR